MHTDIKYMIGKRVCGGTFLNKSELIFFTHLNGFKKSYLKE